MRKKSAGSKGKKEGVEYNTRAGEVRPTQLVYTYGPGSVLDLPNFSVMIYDGDDWADYNKHTTVNEPRLLSAVRALGGPVYKDIQELRTPPWVPPTSSAYDAWATTGVMSEPFPKWVRCTKCNRLLNASVSSEIEFDADYPYRTDKCQFLHIRCSKGKTINSNGKESSYKPRCVPVRFVVACVNGHLDEFPWMNYAHRGNPPDSGACRLELLEGRGSRAIDMFVKCTTCADANDLKPMAMSLAFRSENNPLPPCSGFHPHTDLQESCDSPSVALLVGASNMWFPKTKSVLSLPHTNDTPTTELITSSWKLVNAESIHEIPIILRILSGHSENSFEHQLYDRWKDVDYNKIFEQICQHRDGTEPSTETNTQTAEFKLFATPPPRPEDQDFKAQTRALKPQNLPGLDSFTTVERLREVVALYGFTRVSPPDEGSANFLPVVKSGSWAPVSVVRGEGIFVRFPDGITGVPDKLSLWEENAAQLERAEQFEVATQSFGKRRQLPPASWPGMRYLLLHTFSHMLINQVALECGYATAALKERIYCSPDSAGVLIYTSAPDSEGTLGGLMSLSLTTQLDDMIHTALDRLQVCAGDPLCQNHIPSATEDNALHGAACHYCLFLPETSCERQNRYLDRAVLLPYSEPGFAYKIR